VTGVQTCALPIFGFDEDPERHEIEVASMYDKLERVILPMFYGQPDAYAEVMRSSIAVNGSFFNTQRMLAQYVMNAYFPETIKDRMAVAQAAVQTKA